MIYKKFKQAELFTGKTNKTYEYNIEDDDINYCIVDINGRFPTGNKYALNKECKEMAHILSGSGILVVDNVKYELEKDDVVLIDKLEKYYWEGNIKLGLPCTPAWTPQQHIELEFKVLDKNNKEQFLSLVNEVLNNLENKDFFIPYEDFEYDAMVNDKFYATTFGAFYENKLVGVAVLNYDKKLMEEENKHFNIKSSNICELGGNLVLPEYRGLKIASFLQKMAIDYAIKQNFEYVVSMAHPNNIKGCKTLEGAGLKFLETVKLDSGYLRNLYLLKL